jgi:hypothetical protein
MIPIPTLPHGVRLVLWAGYGRRGSLSPSMKLRHHILAGLAIVALGYFGIACIVFQFRNPTANQAACWREIGAVLRFERVERYQGVLK